MNLLRFLMNQVIFIFVFIFLCGCKIMVDVPPVAMLDSTAPTISTVSAPSNGYYHAGQELFFTVSMSEKVVITTTGGIPRLQIKIGSDTRDATYTSGSESQDLIFSYTVQPGETDSDGIEVFLPLELNGGTITDEADNALTQFSFLAPTTTEIYVDTTAPTLNSVFPPAAATYTAGQPLDFVLNFSEIVSVTPLLGTPRLQIDIGGNTRYATYYSGSGSNQLKFRYTILPGEMDLNGIGITSPMDLNLGTILDRAALEPSSLVFTPPTTTGVIVNTGLTAPTISSITPPSNGTYLTNPGVNLDFTVTFSENITMTGTPALNLIIGSTTRRATYLSGSGGTTLTFRYTTVPADSDTDGISLSTNWDFSSGSLANASSVAVSSTILSPVIPNTALALVLVDRSPSISSFSFTKGTYTYGQNLDILINFSETVTGTTSRIGLNIGGSTQYATYVSGSGTSSFTYRWSNVGNLNDNDGIVLISPLDLNGGTLKDAANNNAVLTFTAPDSSEVLIDGTTPPASLTYYGVDNVTYMPGSTAGILYPTLGNSTSVTYTINSILSTWTLDNTEGSLSYQNQTHDSSIRTISASNSAGTVTHQLTSTSLPIIYKNQIALANNLSCAIASGGVFCWSSSTFPPAQSVFPIGTGVKLISGAGGNICAVSGGSLYCWSDNMLSVPEIFGETESSDSLPVNMISHLSVGANHSCYIRLGRAYCFGDNTHGQLGVSAGGSYTQPQLVSSSLYFQKIAVGTNHTCGLSGTNLYCWGNNSYSQLGDGTTTHSSAPLLARDAHDFAVGNELTCALKSGVVYCFGANNLKQLGRMSSGSLTTSSTFSSVSHLAIHSSGDYVMVIRNGEAYGWGNLSVIHTSYSMTATPIDLTNDRTMVNMVAGKNKAYALKNASSSQTGAWHLLGPGTSLHTFNPKASFMELSAGYTSTCIHLSSTPHCFGTNAENELTARTVSAFLPLTNLYNSTVSSAAELNQRIISSSSIGEKHACYVVGAKVICSGKDHYGVGALGNGTTSLTSPTGTMTATGGAPKKLCSGKAFTCSLSVSNQVECWGDDSTGQIASGGYASSATAVSLPVGAGSALDISCMEKSLCVLGENQRIYCQGQDYSVGTFSEVMTSRAGEKFIKLKTGQRFGCAQTEDHKLICFGAVNNTAQQGSLSGVKDEGVIVMSNDNTSLSERPVQEFTVGANHACASSIESDGSETLFCWGDNSRGQVQQTSTEAVIVASSTSGRPVNGTVYDMAAGSEHTCLHISGNIQCFGRKNVLGIDITNATTSDFNSILPLVYR